MDVPAAAGDELRVQLDAPLPAELAVGAGSALFVCGTCFSARARVIGAGDRGRRRRAAGDRARHAAPGHDARVPSGARPVRDRGDGRRSGVARGPAVHQLSQRLLGLREDRPAARGGELPARAARPARRRTLGQRPARRARAPLARSPARPAPPCARGGDLHGHLPAPDRSLRAPGGLDPGADPPRLDLRDQRRRIGSAALRRARGRGRRRRPVRRLALRPATRLLPELRARAGAGARRGALRRAGGPGRRLVPREARDARARAGRRAAGLQRRPRHRPRRATSAPTPTGAAGATTTRTSCRCWSRTP